MLIIVGYIVICASVFGGFAAGGGHLGALMQPLELLMIGGAAGGAFLVGNGGNAIKGTLGALPSVMKGGGYSKPMYMELLALMYDILAKVRKEGLMSIENDVENPHDSPIFSKYPNVSKDHHIVEFMTDYLRLMVGGNLNALEIENLMDIEIETHHQEGHLPAESSPPAARAVRKFWATLPEHFPRSPREHQVPPDSVWDDRRRA